MKKLIDVDSRSFNVMSICSGIGGLDLGIRIAVSGARTVCYVEREVFACAVLEGRMSDGSLDEAPVWDDLATFDGKPWRGAVDCIAAGLPCQPYSVAGKRLGHEDERAIWPDFMRIVSEVRPAVVFLENVPGMLAWFRPVGEALSGLGYELEGGLFTAAEVGASHRRERFFVLAHAERTRRQATGSRRQEYAGNESPVGSGIMAYSIHSGLEGRSEQDLLGQCQTAERDCLPIFPPGPSERDIWEWIIRRWPETQPPIRGVADGTAFRLDQLRALGNSVVPLTAAWAFRILARKLPEIIP